MATERRPADVDGEGERLHICRTMSRTLSLLNAGLFSLALALPALAAPRGLEGGSPSCDPKGEKKEDKNPSVANAECDGPKTDSTKKDEKKNPSVANAECDGPKTDSTKKDEKKNPSVADPQCGGGPKTDSKGDKKNPSFG